MDKSKLKEDITALDELYKIHQIAEHSPYSTHPKDVKDKTKAAFYNARAELETKYNDNLRNLRMSLMPQEDQLFLSQFIHCQ